MDKTKIYPNSALIIDWLLKAEEVAEILYISRSFAYLLMQAGQIPIMRLGHASRVRPQDLAGYIERNILR